MATMKRGRKPRVVGSPSERRVEIRLTLAERLDLESVATVNGTTMADVIREAVNEYVADYRDRAVFRAFP